MKQNWTFALPPSLGDDDERASKVRAALFSVGCRRVRTSLTYGILMDELADGRVDAAWAPPLICARMEGLGSRVVLRAVRAGAATYRAVMFARADKGITLENLAGKQVGWLDQRSMSGYVLPRAMLRARGMDPDTVFSRQKFLGSFQACVAAVLDGKVDVACTFASAEGAAEQKLGYVEFAGERAGELTAIAYSPECPNDGILLSPRITGEDAREMAEGFAKLSNEGVSRQLLVEALAVEGFEVPPEGSYAVLKGEVESVG